MRIHLGACRSHEGGVRHKQVCKGVDLEGQKVTHSSKKDPGSIFITFEMWVQLQSAHMQFEFILFQSVKLVS